MDGSSVALGANFFVGKPPADSMGGLDELWTSRTLKSMTVEDAMVVDGDVAGTGLAIQVRAGALMGWATGVRVLVEVG